MSVKLDKKVSKPEDLSDEQYAILQAQGNLPKGFPFRPELVKNPDQPDLGANTGTVRTMSVEELEAELERRRSEQTVPTIGDKGGIQDQEEMPEELRDVPYDEKPWTNDARRAELSRRGLSVSGDKAELVDRLERSDSDTLTDDDFDADDE